MTYLIAFILLGGVAGFLAFIGWIARKFSRTHGPGTGTETQVDARHPHWRGMEEYR